MKEKEKKDWKDILTEIAIQALIIIIIEWLQNKKSENDEK